MAFLAHPPRPIWNLLSRIEYQVLSTRTTIGHRSASLKRTLLRPFSSFDVHQSQHKLHPIFSVQTVRVEGKDGQAAVEAQKPSFHTDPYPIPLQHPHHHTRQDPSLYRFAPCSNHQHLEPHSDGGLEALRARLVYMSRKRGIVEMELLLSTFVKENNQLKDWSADRLVEYERCLRLPDWDLYYYLIKKQDPPNHSEWKHSKLLSDLRTHTSNTAKQIRMMPDLTL